MSLKQTHNVFLVSYYFFKPHSYLEFLARRHNHQTRRQWIKRLIKNTAFLSPTAARLSVLHMKDEETWASAIGFNIRPFLCRLRSTKTSSMPLTIPIGALSSSSGDRALCWAIHMVDNWWSFFSDKSGLTIPISNKAAQRWRALIDFTVDRPI